MKRIFLCFSLAAFLISCDSKTDKTAETTGTTDSSARKTARSLPYTASYTSNWNTDVSDADLETTLMTYKNWETGDMQGLASRLADSVTVEMSSGDHLVKSNADLIKMWGTYRDSLSSVRIDMEGWHKMYATDKKDGYIVTWYKEYDTFKSGKVDSASFHDINQLKNGKIIWYSQYKRPMK